MVIVPDNFTDDIVTAFEIDLNLRSVSKLNSRKNQTTSYTLGGPSSAVQLHEFHTPAGLGSKCTSSFTAVIHQTGNTIITVPGLPSSVINSAPAALAAALRRGPL